MTNPSTIANLPSPPVPLTGSEYTVIVQNGVTYKVPIDIIPFPSGGTPPVYVGGTSTGSANAQAISVVPTNYAFLPDNIVMFTAGFSNTGPLTINVNGTGAKAVDKITSTGLVALTGGETVAGGEYMLAVNGSVYQLVNPFVNVASSFIPYTPPGTGAVATNVSAELQKGFLHLLDFASGTGGDDTIGVQKWLNACASTSLTGWVDPAPSATYNISSQIAYTGSASGISIMGPGIIFGAKFTLNSLTQNGFYFNSTARLFLSGFGIVSVGTASAGAGIYIDGAATNTVGCILDNIVFGFGSPSVGALYNGLYSTGMATSAINRCEFFATNYGCYLSTPGDTVIENYNSFNPQASGAVGLYLTGDVGGMRVISNKMNSGVNYTAGIVANDTISDGDFIVADNSIESYTSAGIAFEVGGGSPSFGNVIINSNQFSGIGSGSRAIDLPTTTAHWVSNVIIEGNVCAPTSAHGILVSAADNLIISNNVVLDIAVGINCSQGQVSGNTIESGGTISNSSTSVIVVNNPGYNPVGASSQSPGSSPWTYTAGASPETLYMSASTAIATVTVNGTGVLPHATGANVPITIQLPPFGVAVTTYTGALTSNKMIY